MRDLIPAENGEIAIEAIQKAVALYFQVRLINLRDDAPRNLALCRQVAMYLCRELTDDSFPATDESLRRDHSTVIHAHNLIAHRVTNDSTFRDLLDKLGRDLKNRAGKS